jgi:hypothetical protein
MEKKINEGDYIWQGELNFRKTQGSDWGTVESVPVSTILSGVFPDGVSYKAGVFKDASKELKVYLEGLFISPQHALCKLLGAHAMGMPLQEEQEVDEKETTKIIKTIVTEVCKRYLVRIQGEVDDTGSQQKGEWLERIPSHGGYSYRLWAEGGDLHRAWYTPGENSICYRVSRNTFGSHPFCKLKGLGLNVLLPDDFPPEVNTLGILYPSWVKVRDELMDELPIPLRKAVEASPLYKPNELVSLVQNELLNAITSLRNSNNLKGLSQGAGIKMFDDDCPTVVQVWPNFYTMFKKPYDLDPIREMLNRVVVNKELLFAKLYGSLLPHRGSDHKSALYVVGAGSSFKSYLLGKLMASLDFTWHSDGTCEVNPSLLQNPIAHTRKDEGLGGNRFSDVLNMQQSIFLYWTEAKDYSPGRPKFKKMQGTDVYKCEEKNKNERSIPTAFVNIFDSNHPIVGNWMKDEDYDRVIPVGMINPAESGEDASKYYFFGGDLLDDDPRLAKARKVIRNHKKLSARDLADSYTSYCLLSYVLTYGKEQYEKYKAEKGVDISTSVNKNIRELSLLYTTLGRSLPELLEATYGHASYNCETMALILISVMTQAGGELLLKDDGKHKVGMGGIMGSLLGYSSKVAVSGDTASKPFKSAVSRAEVMLGQILNDPVASRRLLGFEVERVDDRYVGISLRPKYEALLKKDVKDSLALIYEEMKAESRKYFLQKYNGDVNPILDETAVAEDEDELP